MFLISHLTFFILHLSILSSQLSILNAAFTLLFTIITDYSFWFIILCILSGAAYSFTLYYKEKRFEEVARWILYLMVFCRFIVVSVLAFLLLSPLVKTLLRQVEKPLIIVAQDNSESLVINKDSSFYKGSYVNSLYSLIDQLDDKYDVKTYSFGDKIENDLKFSYTDKQTDISSLFEEIETRYSDRNLGAVIIASDGLYNKGLNPLYRTDKLKVPLYTIALGDTNVKKDLILNKVEYNRISYLGNKFPLQIVVDAKELKGKNATLSVYKENESLYSQRLDFNSGLFSTTLNLELEAKQPGKQRYSIRLAKLDGEVTYVNNQKDIYIDVLDGRQKILILSNAPHPDVGAIKQTIESNQNYEVETAPVENFNKSLKPYNLVVLYQNISNSGVWDQHIVSEIKSNNIPVLLFNPSKSDFQTGINSVYTNKTNESEPLLSKNFSLFTLSEELKNFVKKLPAVYCPFGNYQALPLFSSNVLLYQRIGVVETSTPMMLFSQDGEAKIGTFIGEGIWKWRLRDYAEHKNHNIFNELINKMVQYLSLKVDKSFFKVIVGNDFYENENIEFEAEVYNDSYELINEPEVTINIINKDNKKFPFTFSKTSNAYRLNAGIFPVGEYRYETKTRVGDKVFTQSGKFTVSALQVESVNTVADHQLLYALAKKHKGEMVYPNEMSKLLQILNDREDIKPVSHSEKKLTDLVNLKILFFLLLFLISLEWFFRKWSGGY